MTTTQNSSVVASFKIASKIAGAVCVVLGIVVLVGGWGFNIADLRSVLPGLATMKVNTALGIACAGGALLSFQEGETRIAMKRLGTVFAWIALLIGLLSLVEYGFGRNLGIDELLFADPGSRGGAFPPGRPSPNTALALLLQGAALLLIDRKTRRNRWPAEGLALSTGAVALIGLIGYFYGVKSLYAVSLYSSMALHTATALVLLAAGSLCARPAHGLMAILSADHAGGFLTRRLLPAALITPPVVGGIRLMGQNAGYYDTQFGLALFATSNVLVFAVLVWWSGYALERLDRQRRRKSDELVQANEALKNEIATREAAQAKLIHAQKLESVGQLTGGIAHDFNNILGAAIGNLDLLAEHVAADPLATDYCKAALDANLRGAELVKHLLAFARRQPLRAQPTDIVKVISTIKPLIQRALGEHIAIEVKLAPDLWEAQADVAQLESAILNLGVNARDAMPEGGTLSIDAANETIDESFSPVYEDLAPGDYVVVSVSDTGTGMSPETLAKVFEPFFTTKAPGAGTGLGLSMVFGTMKQLGGTARVYSELGVGTTVRLYLPRTDEKASESSAANAPAQPIPTGTERILLVDDNDQIRDVGTNILRSLGYQVVTAESGDRAMEMIEQGERFDLLLTDVVMPGKLNGIGLGQALRARVPDAKILLTSGFTSRMTKDEILAELSAELIVKPYRKAELALTVRTMLDRKPGERGP